MPLPTTITCAGSWPEPGALDDRDLVVARRVGPHDQVVLRDVLERVRVGQGDALEHLGHELLGVVDELLHAAPPWWWSDLRLRRVSC